MTLLLALLIAAARIAPLPLLAPFLGALEAPWTARLALALTLSAALTPAILGQLPPEPLPLLQWPALLAAEALAGIVVAVVASAAFYALWLAFEAAIAPALETPHTDASPLSSIATLGATVLFMTTGGHLACVAALGQTLAAWPPLRPWNPTSAAEPLLDAAAQTLLASAALALPFFTTFVLIELGRAAAARLSPAASSLLQQLPARTLAAGALLALGAWWIAQQLADLTQALLWRGAPP